MKVYSISTNGKWHFDTMAYSHEMAYRGICSFFDDKTVVTVTDKATNKTQSFSRETDKAGNLIRIISY